MERVILKWMWAEFAYIVIVCVLAGLIMTSFGVIFSNPYLILAGVVIGGILPIILADVLTNKNIYKK